MDTIEQKVVVNPLPTVILTGLDSIYSDQDTAVTLVGIPSNGTFSGAGVTGMIFDPSAAGAGQHTIYYSFVDANGCMGIDSMIVAVCVAPIAGFNFQQDELSVNFQNTSTWADSTTWDFGDGMTSNDMNPTHTYTTNGTYTACLVAKNDCGADTSCLEVLVTVGTNVLRKPDWAPTIFPNPSSGRVVIDWQNADAQDAILFIYDLLGQQIRQMKKGAETQMIWDGISTTGTPISTGIYLLQFRMGSAIWSERVLIINE